MKRREFLNLLALGGFGLVASSSWVRASDDEGGVLSALYPVPTNTGITGNIVIVGGARIDHTYAAALGNLNQGKAMSDKPFFVCQVCGHTVEGSAPDKCPVCGALAKMFKKVE